MAVFAWKGEEYTVVVPPEDDDPYLALYWEYGCPRAHPYETVTDALCMLRTDEANGELDPVGVVNRFTSEVTEA